MTLAPYLAVGALWRQLRSALLLRRATGWRHFGRWLLTNGPHTIPVSAGAVGMGCIGYGYHAVWEVTEACNLRCRHCHATSGRAGPDELTTDEGRRFLGELRATKKFRMLAFSGGEPLCRPDLDALVDHARRLGLISVIATNGTLIDRARARELRRRGVYGIAVGFDSTDPAVHNHIRQSPTAFERALEGIEAARAAGLVVQVNFTAMRENLGTLPEVIRFCHAIRADIMLCYQLVPMGRGSAIAASALTPAENLELIETVKALQRDAITIVEPVAAPQYFPHLLGLDRPGPKPTTPGTLFHGCAAGWGLVYVKPDGEVWPCPFVPVSGGNLRTTPLAAIWKDSPVFRDLADRTKLKGACGACENRFICGGCRGKAYGQTGDYLAEDPGCHLVAAARSRPV